MVTISPTRVLLIGGDNTLCYIYDDTDQSLTPVPSPHHSKVASSAGKITLTNGREVVIAVGHQGASGEDVEIFDIKDKVWIDKPEWNLPVSLHAGLGYTVDNRLTNITCLFNLIKQ